MIAGDGDAWDGMGYDGGTDWSPCLNVWRGWTAGGDGVSTIEIISMIL